MGDYWSNKYALVKASWQLAEEHNTQMAAAGATIGTLEAKIAELAEERSRLISQLARCGTELVRAKRNGDAQDKLDRIAALVKPVPVAELVEAGTEAPALLAERHRQIRAILEEET